jgi:hypothetical protein
MVGLSVEFATPRVTEILMSHFWFLDGVVPGSVRERTWNADSLWLNGIETDRKQGSAL